MGNGMKHTILFLVVMSSVFIGFAYAEGCGGGCAIGGGSYDFLGDPAVNMDMSSYNEFLRDDPGNNQTTLNMESLSSGTLLNDQTGSGNASQNTSEVGNVINSLGNMTLDNRTVRLGASGVQDQRPSTLAYASSNSFMF